MGYDYQRLFEKIVAIVSLEARTTDLMHDLIEECSSQRPHADWARMREVDFAADEGAIACWLASAFPGEGSQVRKGLWFGLFNPSIDGRMSADIYVAASPEFRRGSIDWAHRIERPRGASYLDSRVLDDICKIAYETKQGLGNDAEYPLALAYGAISARSAVLNGALPIGLRAIEGAAVGFDSGDFLFLGEFADGTFRLNVEAG